tara:strand:- start:315 stop:422 length:108 start_codon:yes stop_codon:yes gene_type:complete
MLSLLAVAVVVLTTVVAAVPVDIEQGQPQYLVQPQ